MRPIHEKLTTLRPILLAAALGIGGFASPMAAQAQDQTLQRIEATRTITVIGEGGATVIPDRATVTIGVTIEDPEASAALRGMSDAMTAVLARLAAAGVAETDVQTGVLSLGPRWDYSPADGQPVVDGFTATTMVTVLVRDLDDLGTILDAVVQDGANRLDGIGFSVSDDRAALDDARRAAVADARARADLYAMAAGVTLGEVIAISEQTQFDGPMPQLRMAMEAAPAVPVAAGEINLLAQVTIIYAIAD